MTIANNAVTGAKIALGSDAQGDVMYYNGTDWARLQAGTVGQYLATGGAGANPAGGRPRDPATSPRWAIALPAPVLWTALTIL